MAVIWEILDPPNIEQLPEYSSTSLLASYLTTLLGGRINTFDKHKILLSY
jgi:hypothetical protein